MRSGRPLGVKVGSTLSFGKSILLFLWWDGLGILTLGWVNPNRYTASKYQQSIGRLEEGAGYLKLGVQANPTRQVRFGFLLDLKN